MLTSFPEIIGTILSYGQLVMDVAIRQNSELAFFLIYFRTYFLGLSSLLLFAPRQILSIFYSMEYVV